MPIYGNNCVPNICVTLRYRNVKCEAQIISGPASEEAKDKIEKFVKSRLPPVRSYQCDNTVCKCRYIYVDKKWRKGKGFIHPKLIDETGPIDVNVENDKFDLEGQHYEAFYDLRWELKVALGMCWPKGTIFLGSVPEPDPFEDD